MPCPTVARAGHHCFVLTEGNIMGPFLLALLGLLAWVALGIFVAFCISAGNRDARRRL
jgi:hypothetical protein